MTNLPTPTPCSQLISINISQQHRHMMIRTISQILYLCPKSVPCSALLVSRILVTCHQSRNQVTFQIIFFEEDNSDSFVFCCEVHSLTFENLEDFEEHQISNHSVNGRVACGICDKTYSTKYLRRNHIKGYQKFTCGVQNCGKTFPLKRYRDAHERSYRHQGTNSSLLYACDVCNEVFNDLEELKQHKLKYSSTKKFHCEYCRVKGYTQ